MKTMKKLKLVFAAGAGKAATLAGGAATVAIAQTDGGDKLTAQEIAGKSHDARPRFPVTAIAELWFRKWQ